MKRDRLLVKGQGEGKNIIEGNELRRDQHTNVDSSALQWVMSVFSLTQSLCASGNKIKATARDVLWWLLQPVPVSVIYSAPGHVERTCLQWKLSIQGPPVSLEMRWEGEWQRCEQKKKEAIFRSVLLEYIHISCANTSGMGELTAAIVEIPDILPKTHQFQIVMILGEKRTVNDHLH